MNRLLDRLFVLNAKSSVVSVPILPRPKILYCVSHAYPFSSNGYAVRTHGVATGLIASGFDLTVASRPGFPWDVVKGKLRDIQLLHRIDGVKYVFANAPSRNQGALGQYLQDSVGVIKELIRVFRPSLVVAASNWHNALPVSIAAHELGVPFYYEVRGFWEISHVAKDPAWQGSEGFVQEVRSETVVAKSAEGLFTLNKLMKAELIRRGVEEERIKLVPNSAPEPLAVCHEYTSLQGLGITSRYVIGYIGSFTLYEGLEDLIKALAIVRQTGLDVSLLLVGSGQPVGVQQKDQGPCDTARKYLELATQLKIGEYLFMPGRVEPQLTSAYYELIDLIVVPRKPLDVCELVTPMKPFEAAVHGKCVLMSDVAPLVEIAQLCDNFKLYEKGSVTSLASKIVEILGNYTSFRSDHQKLKYLSWENNVKPMVSEFKQYARS